MAASTLTLANEIKPKMQNPGTLVTTEQDEWPGQVYLPYEAKKTTCVHENLRQDCHTHSFCLPESGFCY